MSGTSWPVASAAAARRSLRPTSCERARSRRWGVSAARWRYGRARADGIAPAGVDGVAQRALGTDEDGARDEQLGQRRCRAPTAGRRGSPRTGRRASGRSSTTSTLLALSLPWEMPAAWRRATCSQSSSSVSSLTSVGLDELERLDVRLAGHEQRVAVRAEGGGHDLGHPDPGLRGHERRQRLVLDLLQPADRGAPGRIPVGQEPPAPGEPLRVLRVAAEDAHPQGPTLRVAADVLRVADALSRRRAPGRSPRPRARSARRAPAPSAARPRPSRRPAARAQPAPRPSASPARAPDGSAAPSTTAPSGASGTSQSDEQPNRPDELRADDDDHRGRPRRAGAPG